MPNAEMGARAPKLPVASRPAAQPAGVARITAPAPRADGRARSNRGTASILPAPLGPMYGRAAELGAVTQALDAGERLVTLTGPGGIGKTRLALATAAHFLPGCADHQALNRSSRQRSAKTRRVARYDQVLFCDLSAARNFADVCAAMADAVGATPTGVTDDVAQLGHALTHKGAVLLILDNVEQILEVAADLVLAWLSQAPGLACILTSRERAGLAGELVVEVGPLVEAVTSDAGVRPGLGPRPITAAGALFVDRATRANRDIGLRPDDLAIIEDVVERLDRIPLAIELAAACAAIMSPLELRQRLAQRLDFLGVGDPSRGGRHRTLHQTIDWSWQLLSSPERSALGQCAIFGGSFALDAAETVVTLEPCTSDSPTPEVLDVLLSLRDKSLLWSRATEVGTRVALYETIRDFACAMTPESARQSAARRHARYYARWVGGDGVQDEGAIAAERQNLVVAIEYALSHEQRDPYLALSLLRGLGRLAYGRVPVAQHRVWIDRALFALHRARREVAASPETSSLGVEDGPRASGSAAANDAKARNRDLDALEVDALRVRSGLVLWLGEMDGALADARAAVETARQLGQSRLEGMAERTLSQTLVQFGDFEAAIGHGERAVSALSLGADRYEEAVALRVVGNALHGAGRVREARRAVERSASLLDDIGKESGPTLNTLGNILVELGDPRAVSYLERAIALHARNGCVGLAAQAAADLGVFHHGAGLLDEAQQAYGRGLAVMKEQGFRPMVPIYRCYLGIVHRERGDTDCARTEFRRAIEYGREVGEQDYTVLARAHLAAMCFDEGRVDEGEALGLEVDAALPSMGASWLAPAIRLALAHRTVARLRGVGSADGTGAELRRAIEASMLETTREDHRGDSAFACSVDARIALRLLEAAYERAATPIGLAGGDARAFPEALVVDRRGRWFRPPHGAVADCQNREALRNLLVCLAQARVETPGRSLSSALLVASGWPGQRILPGPARNRLHVAVAALRKLGLREVLIARDGGYLLERGVPLRLV